MIAAEVQTKTEWLLLLYLLPFLQVTPPLVEVTYRGLKGLAPLFTLLLFFLFLLLEAGH